MIFQFGWASVQISHLALIPELSSIDSSRTIMNSLRYSFTVIANLSVFVVLAWFLSQSSGNSQIGPNDFTHFRTAGFLVVGAGLVATILFYLVIREPKHGRRLSRLRSISSDASELVKMHWTSWFGHIQFYQKYVAILPMVSYISSFLVSGITGLPLLNRIINRKCLFLLGLLCGIGTCAWMLFDLSLYGMYSVAALIGVSQAVLLITSLSLTADLINRNTESGAFVYGAMSFIDKLANGVAYLIIELWNPSCDPEQPHSACTVFYRTVMVYVPGGCLALAIIVLMTLFPLEIGRRVRPEPSK
ncbi:hypothetical protein OESDEN_01715 [Oesophagostomum dentatum]|uniref:Major facilitator superfamily (MFS) profile domain-containing protein n=1 Tax=Oesophagostomum dentatum TaxID=61180 RepID=A0A0B1TR57_OESDE|nr:hypothetical protein OESDEN_01715 [Oesophagostomum dentatum]